MTGFTSSKNGLKPITNQNNFTKRKEDIYKYSGGMIVTTDFYKKVIIFLEVKMVMLLYLRIHL